MTPQQKLKEYSSIVIARQAAIKAAQAFITDHQLKLSAADLFLLIERFYGYIETGDCGFKVKLDKYLGLKADPLFEETLNEKVEPK